MGSEDLARAGHRASPGVGRDAVADLAKVGTDPAQVEVGDRVMAGARDHEGGLARDHEDPQVEHAAADPGLADRALDLRALGEQELDQLVDRGSGLELLETERIEAALGADVHGRQQPLALGLVGPILIERHARGRGAAGELDEDRGPAAREHLRAQLLGRVDAVEEFGHRDAELGVATRGPALVEELGDAGRRLEHPPARPLLEHRRELVEVAAIAELVLARREDLTEANPAALAQRERVDRRAARARRVGEASLEQERLDLGVLAGRVDPDQQGLVGDLEQRRRFMQQRAMAQHDRLGLAMLAQRRAKARDAAILGVAEDQEASHSPICV